MTTLRTFSPLAAVIALTAALVAPASARDDAPAAPTAPQKVTAVEGVTEYRLDNGLRVLLYPDPSAAKVSVVCTVFVGSRHEGYGETGVAHLLEHMNFKGTPTHKDIKKAISDRGGTPAATTSFDQTWYYETLPATDDNLEFAVRLEADRLVNSLMRREDLASEMTVVRSEFESKENDPGTVLQFRMLGAAYEWHNYGKVPIGNLSDIERVPVERVEAFYRKHYRPDNAVLIVAGKFDEQKALAYAARHFGPLENPARKIGRARTEEPPQDGERLVTLRRVGTTGAVGAMYHIPAAAHPDFAPLAVLARVLGARPEGRLYKALVAAKKSSDVGAVAWVMHDPGVFFLSAQVDRGQSADAVRDVLLEVVENLAANKVTEEEVRQARAELTNGWHLKSSHAVADELRQWAGCGDWRLLFLHRERLTKVTADDVNRVAARYLVRTNRTLGVYVPTEKPERARVPATPDLAAALKDFRGGKAVAAGEDFDPTPENIEKRLRRVNLDCGVKAALLPRKTRGETVILELVLRYGNEESLAGLNEACEFLPMMMLRGSRGHDFASLNRELVRLDNANIFAKGSVGVARFGLQCKRQHLPEVLKMLGGILREPSFPKEEFERVRRATVEDVRAQLKEPGPLAVQALSRRLHPYPKDNLRYVPTIEEMIARYDATSLEQVRKLYAGQLGATTGELVVVGDFDPDATVRQVQALLDGWKSPTPCRRIATPADTSPGGGSVVIDTPDKANAVYRAGHLTAHRYTDPDYPALVVGNYILGQPGTSSRLWTRLREKDGLSYGVESSYSAGTLDPAGGFEFAAICNPANMPKVCKAVAEEIDRLLKDGVTRDELDAAKKAILASRRTFTDAEIADKLADDLFEGDSFAAFSGRTRKIGELTVDQVNAALRKHLQPKKLVVVEAGDFRKAGAPR